MKPINQIVKAEEILAIAEDKNKIINFIFTFIKCEIYCKNILKKYLNEIGEYTSDEDIELELKKIKEALSDNGYFFEDEKLLTKIFGKKSSSNVKFSCRYLRNKIVHELQTNAINYVLINYDDLIDYMNTFINSLNTQY